jgi:hypothetical protein
MTTKTDNAFLESKLELRRWFLDEFKDKERRVFDACQGSMALWSILRKEYELTSYWGVDVKPKKGRVTVDSARVLALPGFRDNIVDVDTYGEPWKHWRALLPNIKQPTTVFLTVGGVRSLGLNNLAVSMETQTALGLDPADFPHFRKCGVKQERLRSFAIPYLINEAEDKHDLNIVTAKQHLNDVGSAWYIGVRLAPKRKRRT